MLCRLAAEASLVLAIRRCPHEIRMKLFSYLDRGPRIESLVNGRRTHGHLCFSCTFFVEAL